ncbi:conditioned medium-induced protein 4 [Halobellus sp. MBLA0160]|uniref:Conditioned medium-induced protein 4 n=1 Tax=Halobellus ruber TaxID=2761102 RepID=A0A7J9SKG9_9EURY|nr:conditioned medium-induced protein 4 [Halobellus ruber]MBB6647454.1 conditioned medium-induced protein 4 [Halobellus ruber]
MDDETAELRDLFVETTGEEEVTERQTESRGSLSTDDDAVEERLTEIVGEMADRYAFDAGLPESELCRVVRAFFDPDTGDVGASSWSAEADAAVAASLSTDADGEAVFRARMDLHLVADADRDAPFPYATLRALVSDAASGDTDDPEDEPTARDTGAPDDAALAAALPGDVDPDTVRRYRQVAEADLASRRVNHRYRDAFADLLTDADLSTRLASDARRDGLEEATEDIETDVSL